jgi:hypothetical protein
MDLTISRRRSALQTGTIILRSAFETSTRTKKSEEQQTGPEIFRRDVSNGFIKPEAWKLAHFSSSTHKETINMPFELATPRSILRAPQETQGKPTDELQRSLQDSRSTASTAFQLIIDEHKSCDETVNEAIDLIDCASLLSDDDSILNTAERQRSELLLDDNSRFLECLNRFRNGSLEFDDDDSSVGDEESDFEEDEYDECEYLRQCVRERILSRRNNTKLSFRDQRRRNELLLDNLDQLNCLVRAVCVRNNDIDMSSDPESECDCTESNIESDCE